ncbi:MAG: sensor histidine kinase [Oligoflexus sp.]
MKIPSNFVLREGQSFDDLLEPRLHLTTHTLSQILVQMRWFTLVLHLIALPTAAMLGILTSLFIPIYIAMLLVEFILQISMIASNRLLTELKPWIIFLQMAVDVAVFTGLITMSGGWNNPLVGLIFLYLALGAFFLEGFYNLAFFGVVCLLHGIVFIGTRPILQLPGGVQLSESLVLSGLLMTLACTWGVCTLFAMRMESMRKQFFKIQQQKQRRNHLLTLGAMTANVSHALNTPLNTLQMRLDRLKRKRPDLVSDADVLAAQEATHTCISEIANLFDVKSLRLRTQFQLVELSHWTRGEVEKWKEQRVQIPVSFETQLDRAVYAELPAHVLAGVLHDLIGNAIEHGASEDGGVHVVMKQGGTSYGVVEIQDHGAGIDPAILPHLGQPFVSKKPGSHGLGLYDAISLIESLGGRLEIRANKPRGTVVCLYLPVIEDHHEA